MSKIMESQDTKKKYVAQSLHIMTYMYNQKCNGVFRVVVVQQASTNQMKTGVCPVRCLGTSKHC